MTNREINEKILDALVDNELTWQQIAEKFNVTVKDVEIIFEGYMHELAKYYGEK